MGDAVGLVEGEAAAEVVTHRVLESEMVGEAEWVSVEEDDME